MPRLLLFAPCEKVIIDQDNKVSAIAILQEVSLAVQVAENLPSGAAARFTWHIVALWKRDDTEDVGRQYEQSCDLLLPDGQVTALSRATFKIESRAHRNVARLVGFPLFKTPGEAQLRLYLREVDGEPGEARIVASFPLLLRHHSSNK